MSPDSGYLSGAPHNKKDYRILGAILGLRFRDTWAMKWQYNVRTLIGMPSPFPTNPKQGPNDSLI